MMDRELARALYCSFRELKVWFVDEGGFKKPSLGGRRLNDDTTYE